MTSYCYRPVRKQSTLLFLVAVVLITLILYSVKVTFTFNSSKTTQSELTLPDICDTVPTYTTVRKNYRSSSNGTTSKTLAWILNFNREPHPEVVSTLLRTYAKHYVFIAIMSPTGRIGQLEHITTTCLDSDIEIVWSSPCPNSLHNEVAGGMTRCYAKGLELLQSSYKFKQVDYVVLSNDDVVLNMTKVKEFASEGVPVSHGSIHTDAPPMFDSPPVDGTYYVGFKYASWWPECQQVFSKVPLELKERFEKRLGVQANLGRVDAFFLPVKTVPEFTFLSSIVSECWMEMAIPNTLAMLSVPTRFYSESHPELLMYRGINERVTPEVFEKEVNANGNNFLSFHSFKLSYSINRLPFPQLINKYKLS